MPQQFRILTYSTSLIQNIRKRENWVSVERMLDFAVRPVSCHASGGRNQLFDAVSRMELTVRRRKDFLLIDPNIFPRKLFSVRSFHHPAGERLPPWMGARGPIGIGPPFQSRLRRRLHVQLLPELEACGQLRGLLLGHWRERHQRLAPHLALVSPGHVRGGELFRAPLPFFFLRFL